MSDGFHKLVLSKEQVELVESKLVANASESTPRKLFKNLKKTQFLKYSDVTLAVSS